MKFLSKGKPEKKVGTIQLRDFSKLLKALEGLLKSSSTEKTELLYFLIDLRQILKKYGYVQGSQFLEVLTKSLTVFNEEQQISNSVLNTLDVKKLALGKIKEIIFNPQTKKDDLLLIAEKRMGIPKGSLMRFKKELLKDRILSEIENIEKFETIKKQASE